MNKNLIWDDVSFGDEAIKQLSPEKRSDMIRIAIKKILNQHPEGLTIPDIVEMTGLSTPTVRKHVEFLTAVRESYQKNYGARIAIYFPNGKLVHPYSDSIRKIGDSLYSFQRVENTWGEFIYIQERKKDPYTNKTKTVGGIMVEKENLEKFIAELREELDAWKSEDEGQNRFKIGR